MAPKDDIHKNLFTVIYLNSIVPLSAGLKSFLMKNVKSTLFSKGELVCREGEQCTRLYVIKKGLVRGFFTSDDVDITTWISSDNEVFTSITGFFQNSPAKENIQCLEDTHCSYLEYDDMYYCLRNFPEFKDLNRKLLEEYYIHAENRAFMARIPNALKRWSYYLNTTNPEIIDRIPNKFLASLLVMRPETLSRTIKEHAKFAKTMDK